MEFELIERIRQHTALAREDVRLGVGDDAAVVRVPPGHDLVMALDTLVEGVHFPAATAPADVGWKALAVNLSDLAAMGARPAWAMLGLTLHDGETARVDGLARGFAELARAHAVALVGGDTTRGPFSLSVAIHGLVPAGQALVRSGARVGDRIMVTGTLGDAGAGLLLAQGAERGDPADPARAWLRQRLDRPTPRIAAGLALRGLASACIDISDGLLADLGHVCAASGVAAELDVDALPLSGPLRAVVGEAHARQLALRAGDDYELCFTVPAARQAEAERALAGSGCAATCIGRIVPGTGVQVPGAAGGGLPGWNHFPDADGSHA